MANTATYSDPPNLAAWNTIAGSTSNVCIVWGTYAGTGEYGTEHPNTLSFDGTLLRVTIVQAGDSDDIYRATSGLGLHEPC